MCLAFFVVLTFVNSKNEKMTRYFLFFSKTINQNEMNFFIMKNKQQNKNCLFINLNSLNRLSDLHVSEKQYQFNAK